MAAVIAASSVVAASVPASAASPTVSRTYGADRYATSVALAKSKYPTGAPAVFLASGTNFPDALAAGPAAAKLGGPLLLTAPSTLPSEVSTELAALHPTNIYVVGGTSAVSASVLSQAERAVPGASVTRLYGSDRYATGRAVVAKAFGTASKVYVATGTGFADALSAAAAAGNAGDPVLLVNGSSSSLDSASSAELTALHPTSVMIAGGTTAVSSGIQSQLDARYGTANVVREGGANRYATSALIGESQFGSAGTAYFASGTQFPDALAASAIAGANHAPLLTVEPTCVPTQTASALTSLGTSSVVLAGGPSALSANVAALGSCSAPHTIQNTSATYAIQSSVTLTGSGQGYHAKIELVTATAAVTFGIQYDAAGAAPYTGKPAFLLENVVNASGESGNAYTHTGAASLGKAYQLLLTLQSSGAGTVYVNGTEVGTFTNKNLANTTVYARVQAVGKQNGDKADASFAGTLVNEKGSIHSATTSVVYPNGFTTNTAAGKTTNPITISGTVSGLTGNWSTANPSGVTVQFK